MMPLLQILQGDCRQTLKALPDQSVRCCVTSPPYFGLRDYGHEAQIGLEQTPEEFVAQLVAVFEEVRRVLTDDGTLWLNIGDTYAGSARGAGDRNQSNKGNGASRGIGTRTPTSDIIKPKDLIGIPWRLAFALQAQGWYLRQNIIWNKPNPMPESVRDRCTKAHEDIFLLAKTASYFFDADAIAEPAICGANGSQFHTGKTGEHQLGRASTKPRESKKRGEFNGKTNAIEGREAFRAITETRNKRSVWTIPSQPYRGAHFATFPPALVRPCILAGTQPGDVVLDPFGGSGTTAAVALELGRSAIVCELNAEYVALIEERCAITPGLPLHSTA